jgi:diguanylate cyclase (GGDEF)-like protein
MGIAALAWVIAAGPLRLFQRASTQFAIGHAALLLGIVCMATSTKWGSPLWAPDAMTLASIMWLWAVQRLCLGLHWLYELKLSPLIQTRAWVFGSAVLVALGMFSRQAHWGWTAVWLMSSAMLWHTVVKAQMQLKVQHGRPIASWSMKPWIAIMLLWLLAAGLSSSAALPLPMATDWLDMVQWWAQSGCIWLIAASWWLVNAALVGWMMLKLVDKIRELSQEDEDDQSVLNLRSFLGMLHAERARLRRTPKSQSVLVMELDQLKSIQKQLGFAAGDAACRHLTQMVSLQLRKSDRLGRSATAEWLFFLPDTPLDGAMILVRRILACLPQNPWLWNGQAVPLTLSIGMAHRSSAQLACEALLELARFAMRKVSRAGGNGAEQADHPSMALEEVQAIGNEDTPPTASDWAALSSEPSSPAQGLSKIHPIHQSIDIPLS